MLRVTKMALLTAVLLGVSASPTLAATINVTTTQDVSNNGQCSLRDAVTAANTARASGGCPAGAYPSSNRIVLGSGRYALTAGELLVNGANSSLTIVGQGVDNTTIDALGLSRVLEVLPTTSLTLSNLTLTGGRAPDGVSATMSAPATAGGSGGGVTSAGSLRLDHVVVTGNQAGTGGANPSSFFGVYYRAGHGGNGGGIESSGWSLTIVDSTIAGNRAGDAGAQGGASGNGGGIDVSGGVVSVTGTTISANVAGNATAPPSGTGLGALPGGSGGGLALSNPASGTLANDTIANNAAGNPAGYLFRASAGGAISQAGGQLTLTHVTMAGNTQVDYHGIGGSISTTGGLTVANSALEGSCNGPVADGGHNFTLIPSGYDVAYSRVCPGTQLPAAAFNLGPLQNNGGPTQTMLPGPGSPLIGAVPRKVAGSLATDQRGVARPQGPASDAGAVEVRVPAIAVQPRPVNFGHTKVRHVRRVTVRVRVTAGEMPLSLGRARITGRNARDFTIVKNRYRGKTLNPGQSCTLVISLRPRQRGVRTAKLMLNVKAPGAPVKTALVGTGVP